jgi:manganese/zinc/iron transport system ATP- binding protein
MTSQAASLASVVPPAGMSGAPAIAARNINVSYEGRPVLRSVSFEAAAGRLVSIVGPNGAGKSTLLKAMLGLVPCDSGATEVFGQPISRSRQRVAYVPQTEAVDWDFPVTVLEVVLIGRYGRLGLLGRPNRHDMQAAMEALNRVDMQPYRHRHIRRLSGGQQQRVFLARALCQQADVFLLDEPLAGVDAATERALFELIGNLTADGKTLLMVNHDLSVLHRFDAVMLLNQRVVAYGPPAEVVTDKNIQYTYAGRLSVLDRADAALRGEIDPPAPRSRKA